MDTAAARPAAAQGQGGKQPLEKTHGCSGLFFPLGHQEDGW